MARHAIVVLGMHRSGTSALAGTLVCLGATPPRTLMPPAEENPKGFWESSAVCAFHDQLLAALGTTWDDWDVVDPGRLGESESGRLRAELTRLIESEFGDAPIAIIKDPRMCRLVPLWRRVLDDAGFLQHFVITLRDPTEVSRSLAARDGIGPGHATLLWLRHVLEAERDTRGASRSIVSFDQLLSDPAAVTERLSREIPVTWPVPLDRRPEGIREFLSPSLRHHRGDAAAPLNTFLASIARTTERALSRLAEPSR